MKGNRCLYDRDPFVEKWFAGDAPCWGRAHEFLPLVGEGEGEDEGFVVEATPFRLRLAVSPPLFRYTCLVALGVEGISRLDVSRGGGDIVDPVSQVVWIGAQRRGNVSKLWRRFGAVMLFCDYFMVFQYSGSGIREDERIG